MPLRRRNAYSGAPWESEVGYSRVVRMGAQIAVSGTTAPGPYGPPSAAEAYSQATAAFERIREALEQVDAGLEQVIRTRMFVVDIDRDWQAVGKAHAEALGEVQPAASMVEVRRLIDPGMLVEIEADAVAEAEP